MSQRLDAQRRKFNLSPHPPCLAPKLKAQRRHGSRWVPQTRESFFCWARRRGYVLELGAFTAFGDAG